MADIVHRVDIIGAMTSTKRSVGNSYSSHPQPDPALRLCRFHRPPKATNHYPTTSVQTSTPHPIQAEERASTSSSSRLRMRARASSISSFKAWYQLHPTPLIHPGVGVAAHTPPDGSPSFYSSAASDRTGRSSSGSGSPCTPSAACR